MRHTNATSHQGINSTVRLNAYESTLAHNNKKHDISVRIAGYEGGASGYDSSSKNMEGAGEIIGKSKVSAVAGADVWMLSWIHGWVYQTNFVFFQGNKWSLFEPMGNDFRPRPPWLAMAMINRQMYGGDILTATITNGPETTYHIPDKYTRKGKLKKAAHDVTIQRLGAYAMGNDERLSILVVNRSLTESSELSFNLPVTGAASVNTTGSAATPRIGTGKQWR